MTQKNFYDLLQLPTSTFDKFELYTSSIIVCKTKTPFKHICSKCEGFVGGKSPYENL